MARKMNEITYEVTYTGGLNTSTDVYMHYGYENWSDVSEKKMRKLKSSCKTEITLPADAELNFCFRDGWNNWDNNYGNNYYFVPNSNLTYGYVDICEKTTTTKTAKGTSNQSTTVTKTTKSATSKAASTKTAKATTASLKSKTASKSKD
ncbi:MAG: hypothetical protein IJ215_04895 [Clostridia bacterium]|nr:hypothetical protein [Clostridia bacterium]